jgi:hypothetical protein
MAGAEDENFETYKLLFDNWRFQVQNNWQRSSYFAVFETAALAGAWSVIDQHFWSGLFFAFLGAALTLVWTFSNHRSGLYASYWWKSLCRLERKASGVGAGLNLVCEYDSNRKNSGIAKAMAIPRLRYTLSMQFVPTLFTVAWLGLAVRASLKLARHFNWVCWAWVGFTLTLVLLLVLFSFQVYLVSKDSKEPMEEGAVVG